MSAELEKQVFEMAVIPSPAPPQKTEPEVVEQQVVTTGSAPMILSKAQNGIGDSYFPITLSFPGSTPATTTATALTEAEKRKRMLMGVGGLLAALFIVLIVLKRK